jgi:hypothetical protein
MTSAAAANRNRNIGNNDRLVTNCVSRNIDLSNRKYEVLSVLN